MRVSDYRQLLEGGLSPEAFVRRGLELLEGQTRELALLALGEWEHLGIAGIGELLPALAAMEKPTWGTWNGLLQTLDAARLQVLAAGTAEDRAKIQRAGGLTDLLALWNRQLAQPMAAAMDIANRIAYGVSPEAATWREAEAAIRGVVENLAADPLADIYKLVPRRAPWFIEESSQVWSFQGRAPDFSVSYTTGGGATRKETADASGLAGAFGRLLGVPHERELRRLLARHTPEEIRGVLLGDFLVGHPVGEGGFGTVHVGRQLSTGRKVAIKLLHDGMPAEIKSRFQREAAYLARFNHRNIVGVLGYGEERWSISPLMDLSQEAWFQSFAKSAPVKTFIAMEWVDGQTLESVYQQAKRDPEGRLPIRTLADWFAQAAGALSAVHAAGLVHRDVKPGNLMITAAGVIKLMDFGIARLQDQTHTLVTTPGRIFGTIMYMSPEQIRAAEAESRIGPSTDIYSLCGTFYELFTRTRLYEHDAQSAETVKTLKLSGQRPQAPRKRMRDLPWEIEVILLGGLEAEIADRYRSMESLERDLRHFLRDEAIEYRRPSLPRRMQLGYRRNRAVTNVVAAGVLAAILGTGFYIHSIHAEQARTLSQKELAQRNAKENLARLAASYEEQGRQELLAGEPLRAAVYLNQAYAMGRDDPPMRLLLAQATRAIPAHVVQSQGHTRGVYTAEFNRDGTKIVTAGRDGTVKIWDPPTGRVLHTLQLDPACEMSGAMFNPEGTRVVAVDNGGHGAVWDVATGKELFRLQGLQRANYTPRFSPDGTRLLTCGATANDGRKILGAAYVWDATDGHRLFVLPHDGPVVCAFFNAAGTRIVTGSEDRCAVVWDAATGKKLQVLAATDPITRAVFSADGSKVAVTSESPFSPIKIYETETGKCLQNLSGHRDLVRRCLFDPKDGKYLVTCSHDATARLWDWQAGDSVVLPHDGQVYSAAFSHDGQVVGTASRDGLVKLWDTATGGFSGQLKGHTGYVYQLVFSPDDKTILTASEDKTARLWDARSHQLLRILDGRPADDTPKDALLRVIREGSYVTGVAFSPDGTQVLDTSDVPTVRNAATGEGVMTMAFLIPKTRTACFSPDGKYVAAADSRPGVGLVRLATDEAQSVRLPGELKSLAFSADGKRLIAGGASNAWILDAQDLKTLATLPHISGSGDVDHAEFSPDGQLAVTAGADGTAKLWNAATGALVATLPHEAGVTWATFSPDGHLVLTASRDATAAIWDSSTGKKVHDLKGHSDYVLMAVFSRDGRRIVTASRDYTAKVWDAATGKQLASLEGHIGLLTCANFSPDGSMVVTASEDGRAMVWDAATGRQLMVLRGHTADVRWAEFSPDGTRFVTGSEDDTVRIWDTHLESRTAEQIAGQIRHAVPWRLEGEHLVPATLTVDPVTPADTQAAKLVR